MSTQNRTHPFVIGMIITLFINAVYVSAPANPWETMVAVTKLLIPASVVALFEWWSRKPDLLPEDETDL